MYNNRENIINLSTLGHTWILDLDGTIVKHKRRDHFKNGSITNKK